MSEPRTGAVPDEEPIPDDTESDEAERTYRPGPPLTGYKAHLAEARASLAAASRRAQERRHKP